MHASKSSKWMLGLTVAIVVLAVAGFSIGGTISSRVAASASASLPGNAAAAPSAPLATSPLAEVSGPSLTASTVTDASEYGYTILPDPSALNLGTTMTLQVSVGSASGLESYVEQIQNPDSPMYHQFATLGALGGAFGVSTTQYAADEAYFAGYGLTVTPDPARMYLTVAGTIAEVEAAFHTQIGAFTEQYYSPGQWNPIFGTASAGFNSTTSRLVYLSTGNAYLPSGMHANGVDGLSTLYAQPDITTAFAGLSPATSLSALGLTTSIPAASETVEAGTALGGGTSGACASHNFTWGELDGLDWQFLFPCSMQVLTGATNLLNGHSAIGGAPDKGQGVTIAIVDVGCPFASDFQQFQQQTGVNVLGRLTVIAMNSSGEYYPNTNLTGCEYNGEVYGWTIETSLDIEYAATIAPQAHIVLISTGTSALTAFDSAYQLTADYLTSGAATTLPAGTVNLNLLTGSTTQTTSVADSSVSIESNSYGTGEQLTEIFGSPTYLSLENEELDQLAALGVTNIFASGDSGPTVYPFPLQAGIPADADGQTSVGGGMMTAEYDGVEFPDTGVATNIDGLNMTVAPVSGIGSFTYWSESEYITYQYPTGNITSPALPPGETGGSFGQSVSIAQPWWQNALDVYDSGSLIDPVVSGSAGFNMSVYAFGAWQLTYGGTSFAAPVFAGEWALVEEQALVAFGNARMGDINALLFELHNAQEAGAVPTSAYTPMTNIGTGGIQEIICPASDCGINVWEDLYLWGPSNGEAQYMLSDQDEFPQDQNLPYWFGTLTNPAGSGWNYLQGLGFANALVLSTELIGQDPATEHALDDSAFYILENDGGTLVPIQTLVAGTTYSLEIVSSSGGTLTGPFDLTTYSNGTLATTQIASPDFSYTPGWATPAVFTNGSEYGYFYASLVSGGTSPDWTFQYFAVAQPALTTGTLTLGVETPLGLVTAGEAQVPMSTSTGWGPLTTGGQAIVELNGVPIGGATITQTAVDVPPAAIADSTLPPVAPGETLATYLTSASGTGAFWTDSGQLYVDIIEEEEGITPIVGPLVPVVFTLSASYDGLTSNTITVVAEPDSGYFDPDVSLVNGVVTGTLGFYDMNYLDYLNVSVGSAPGEFVNTTYAPGTVYTGTISVDLTAPTSGPVVLAASAAGEADLLPLSCGGFVGYGGYFALCGLTAPFTAGFVWQDPVVLLPASVSGSQSGNAVTANEVVTWAGTAYPGATGSLALVSSAGTTPLATGVAGSYTLDTTAIPNGAYTLVFTETDPGAATTTSTFTFGVANPAASAPAPPAAPSGHGASPLFGGDLGMALVFGGLGAAVGALGVALATRRRRPPAVAAEVSGPR